MTPIFYSPAYVGAARAFDTTRKAGWIAASLCARPIVGTSDNTASVQVGVIGRTITMAAATSKFKLVANGPKPGTYFCQACRGFFD
jgi:hypothetical protein